MAMTEKVTFALPDPSYESYTWILQDEHNPASHPPLIASASPLVRSTDNERQDQVPSTLNINGFNYAREMVSQGAPVSPFGQIIVPETVDDLTRWREEWLPQVEELTVMLEEFDPGLVQQGRWAEILRSHDDEYRRVFSGVHRHAVGPSRLAVTNFLDAYIKIYGEERRSDGMALLQGFPNLSLDRACALWDLSRIMREDHALHGLRDIDSLFANTPTSMMFESGFREMLEAFGSTTNNGLQDLETWGEGSPIPLAMIRSYAEQEDTKSPKEASLNQERIRLSLERELRDTSNYTDEIDKLLHLMGMAQQLMPNLEDHNYLCDQKCVASSRKRWLNIGIYMFNNGVLTSSSDVFFYTRNELIQILEGGIQITEEELGLRRRVQQQFRTMPPPLHLGLPPNNLQKALAVPIEGITQRIVKGIAASPGNHRGVARVFQSIDEAGSLLEGEILVVRALTPPWTPYVGVAGAVVTNSGGALSHGAVVAREFGIPAVVGTANGTDLIMDGSLVSVDGTLGMIIIEQQ